MKKKVLSVLAGAVLAVAAIHERTLPFAEAGGGDVDHAWTAESTVYATPDNYRNVATFCAKGFRVFVTSRGTSGYDGASGIAVVPDPNCPQPEEG